MHLKDLSISTKLLLAFGTVLLFLTIITVLSWLRFGSVTSALDHADYSTHLNKIILEREIDHLKFVNKAGHFFTDGTLKSMQVETDDHQCALGKWLYGSERKDVENTIPALAGLLQKLEQPHARLHDSVKQINTLAGGQEKSAILPEAQKIFEGSTKSALVEIEGILREMIATVEADAAANRQQVGSFISSGRNLILFFAVLTFILGLIISVVISRSIAGSTRQLAAITDSLAKGNMTTRSTLSQDDEIGRLACSTNNLAISLDNMCARVHCSSSTINGSAENLDKLSGTLFTAAETMSGSCNTVAAAAEQMNANMNAIAAAAEETSTNVTMVAAAAEEMTSTIAEIAHGSENARVIALQGVEEAGKASASVQELGDAARLIGRVTETINEIADQTNLLALNATIEAARAGDAGKGFAVVANEIKELAKQTTEATREIRSRIESVQTSSEQTIAIINTITTIINDTNDIVAATAAAVEEQAVTSKEIANNVSQASVGMHEVTENIAQASVANAEVTRDINLVRNEAITVAARSSDIKELAAEMKNNAAALETLLNRFSFRPGQFDIGRIKDAHFNWKMRLTAVLSGYTTIESKNIPNHHQCDFGKWYDNAPAAVKIHPLFKEVGVHHEAVHVKVVQAVDLFNSNKTAEARRKVEEFEDVRKKLFASLDEMYIS